MLKIKYTLRQVKEPLACWCIYKIARICLSRQRFEKSYDTIYVQIFNINTRFSDIVGSQWKVVIYLHWYLFETNKFLFRILISFAKFCWFNTQLVWHLKTILMCHKGFHKFYIQFHPFYEENWLPYNIVCIQWCNMFRFDGNIVADS